MVRAILDGNKTQTRRIIKPQPVDNGDDITIRGHRGSADYLMREIAPRFWVRFAVGDVLWVREALQCDLMENFLTGERDTNAAVAYYAADDAEVVDRAGFNLAWAWKRGTLPAMFMPRAFSRITLKVTGVKVERLQDISEGDALAEGIERIRYPEVGDWGWPQQRYRDLWSSINGPGSWDANPWVCAISFERIPREAPTG